MLPLALAAVLWSAVFATAQTRRALTRDDYARAESFLSYRTNPLLLHGAVRPTWLPDGRCWYRTATASGAEFVLVDPGKGERAAAFDHAKVAAALSAAGAKFGAGELPLREMRTSGNKLEPIFGTPSRAWKCAAPAGPCAALGEPPAPGRDLVISPDGRQAVFIRDYNLWVRDPRAPAGSAEIQLTHDGIKDFGYATNNAGWTRSDRPVVVWSPDSSKIATFQQNERGVGEMYLVETRVGHPILHAWKYPMAGDAVVATIQRVVIDVATARVVRLRMPPDAHRSTYYDDLALRGDWGDVQWNEDSTGLVFASVSRDHKLVTVRSASALTGNVRDVFEERAATCYGNAEGRLNWKYLPASREVVWFSERDDWGHLYLYDLETGKLKNRITRGAGNVVQLLRVDEKQRQAYFLGAGRETGRDPYFQHLYRVDLDGRSAMLLTPEDSHHEISISPDGRYFTDAYSRPDVASVSVLRDVAGGLVVPLERADLSRLLAAGWRPPIPITVMARDGVTTLYGLMYQPTHFDPAGKYPIINHVYPDGSVGTREFLPSRTDSQALAELGFIVVEIDGMGGAGRSKSFFDVSHGNLADSTIPDQIAGMTELARRYPWIDIDRAGIHGHSGGGYSTAAAMFRYPEFFKVGVSQAGDHDNRAYEDDWVELAQGLLVTKADGTSNYDAQANQNFARNLQGHLLLAHGTMDTNVSPYNTLLVVNALIQANKDFDLLLLPNRNHNFSNEPYMTRRRWDYFVRHLLGVEPPAGYELRPPG